jgi:TolB-like protein
VLAARTRETTPAAVFQDARAALLDVLATIGWDNGVVAEDVLSRHAPPFETAARLYDARLLLASKPAEARALYAQAMKEDPALANTYADLKAAFKDVASSLAVLSFLNLSGRADDEWMGTGVVQALSTDLPRLGFSVVERSRVDELLLAGGATTVDGAAAASAGKLLNADYTVLGSVLHQAPALRVDLRVVDVATGVVAFSAAAENKRDDLAAVIRALTNQLAERFNTPLGDADLDALLASKMSPEEFREAMRAELARSRLRAEQKQEEKASASAPLPVLPLVGAGGVVVGLGVGLGGAFAASTPAAEAIAYNSVRSIAQDADDALARRDAAARTANMWTAVAVTGVVVAVAGLGLVAWDALAGEPPAAPPDAPATTATTAATTAAPTTATTAATTAATAAAIAATTAATRTTMTAAAGAGAE